MSKFRFKDLEIWKMAIDIADRLFKIAERSGSNSKKEFAYFLNIARRSTFENANIIIVLHKRKFINDTIKDNQLNNLDHLCGKITNFIKSLKP